MQVPAGTIRPGEEPRAAVLRETREETGYDCFAVVRDLGVVEHDAGDAVHVRHFFELRPTAPLPATWTSAETHDGQRPPTAFDCFWVPLDPPPALAGGLGARLADLGRAP